MRSRLFIAELSKFSAARLMARGQSHEIHVLDGAHFKKARRCPLKADEAERRVVASARETCPDRRQVAACHAPGMTTILAPADRLPHQTSKDESLRAC